jgi:two-component sensor histidine kinase/methyl-accepting chemotaxis protein/putative methionine-R-sulfoxide reductase with GAF domain
MQLISETIDAPIAGSLDTDLDQADVAVPFGRDLLHALRAMQEGDFSVRMVGPPDGLSGQIAEAVNVIAEANRRIAQQLERVGDEVRREGRIGHRIKLGLPGHGWSEIEGQLNGLIDTLLWPTAAITRAVAALAKGDLTQTVALDVDGRPLKGEFLQSATAVNTMMRQFGVITAAITRLAREVASEGKLDMQVQVPEAAGAWKDVIESVNTLAHSVTMQVRNIADVTVAVAKGDLSTKMTVDARGEMLQLKDTINAMVDQLHSFAAEVNRVVREVGAEGRLGGQADVPGAAGAWKDLTVGVNHLAASLTTQLRGVAEVSAAAAKGDLTRSIVVDASGEVADLRDSINTMIDSLRSATDRNAEQDWLRNNLARIAGLLQGQHDAAAAGRLFLSELIPLVNAQLGAIYRMETRAGASFLKVLAAYADDDGSLYRERIPLGAGLIGQCAIDKRKLLITEMPTDTAAIGFSMFKAVPQNVIVIPVLFDNELKAIIELASVSTFTTLQMTFLEQIATTIGMVLNSIETASEVEVLLKQSRQFACELQTRQIGLERRIAESAAELERSKSRLRDSEDSRLLALAAGKMGSWDWDLVKGHCLWDAGQRQIFGADPASFDVALQRIRALVDRGDWKMLCRQLKRARQKGGAWQLEFRVRRPDGVRWCLGTAIAAQDAGGRVSRIRGVTVDITERKEAEDRQLLLAREVDHRTKNALAVVHAIVSLTRADGIEQFSASVEGRVHALARAHSLLSDSRWRGAKIADLIQGELASFRSASPGRIRISGRSMALHPFAVQALALTLHELAANAARHGALSAPPPATIRVAWEQHGDELELWWIECGVPCPQPPVQEGLGMRIIKASVETQLCGSVEFDWKPDGLCCAIRVPCHPKTELSGNFLYSIQNPDSSRRIPVLS